MTERGRRGRLAFEIRDRIWLFDRIELRCRRFRNERLQSVVDVFDEEGALGSAELESLRPLNDPARVALAELLLQIGGAS